MRRKITFPKVEGQAPRQAHADFSKDLYEREMGKEGFFGPSAHILHKHPPTGWTHIEGPLLPHAFDLNLLGNSSTIIWDQPVLLKNSHFTLRYLHLSDKMDYLVKNADGDILLFVHKGQGDLYCDFGHMTFRDGDYLLIQKGVTWRMECDSFCEILCMESIQKGYELPDRGILGQHAQFDLAVLESPKINEKFKDQQDEKEWQIHVKKFHQVTKVIYPFNPLDAVGWQGDLVPVKLNWRQIRPIMSHSYHLPPSVHTTFLTPHFVICTFCPRPFESDEGALKVPFFHNNDDYDEILFYHAGDFFSRDNIDAGMLTLHPCGLPHGPQPKALKKAFKQDKAMTDEVAVMIDTRESVEVTEYMKAVENKDYADSWKG